MVRTHMLDALQSELGELYGIRPDGLQQWMKGFDPQERISEPDDVADVVAFLASDDARAMTSQAINLATLVS